MKAADGDESQWPIAAPSVFWAERITVQKLTGYSPYYIAHGVEPLMQFDLSEATYLAPRLDHLITTEELIALRAKMFQKRPQDLQRVKEMVMKSRLLSVEQYKKEFASSFKNYDFKPGSLVLVQNSKYDKAIGSKTKLHYIGPMIVLRHTKGGSYYRCEMDGSVSKLCFAAFRLIPYRPRDITAVPLMQLEDDEIAPKIYEIADSDDESGMSDDESDA